MPSFIAFLAFTLFAIAVAPTQADENLAYNARLVLRTHCHECHNGPGSAGGEADFLDRDSLIKSGLIEEGDPNSSYLLDRIVDKSMPPLAQRQHNPVTEAELETLRSWISAGAAEWPNEAELRGRVSTVAVLEGVKEFLDSRDAVERSAFRFFSLAVQHNDPRVTNSDLRLYRAALSKAVNSLSWSRDILRPIEVPTPAPGDSAVILAIDLRLLSGADGRPWATSNHWRQLSRAYPYGVSYVNRASSPEARLQREVNNLVDPAGRELLPILRADWFIATATRPPLYHTLLGVPDNEPALLKMLGVDPLSAVASLTPKRFARAGFTKSGVSGQNRLLERLTSKHGAYWRSFDFLPSTKRSNLRRFPLGPDSLFAEGRHPHPDQSFAHDGGEIIFELPNGLDGYMLVDGAGGRINAGPIDVVHDRSLVSGTPEIVTGVSCMWCHREGMIGFVDEIRSSDAVFGEAQELVRRLYPPQEEMDRLVEKDRQRFVAALEEAIGPALLQGEDAERSVADFQDPVGEVSRRHRSHYLNADALARELDVANGDELREQLGRRSVRELALQPVLSGNGLIGRAEWEASDGRSLMQEVAAALGLTPIQ